MRLLLSLFLLGWLCLLPSIHAVPFASPDDVVDISILLGDLDATPLDPTAAAAAATGNALTPPSNSSQTKSNSLDFLHQLNLRVTDLHHRAVSTIGSLFGSNPWLDLPNEEGCCNCTSKVAHHIINATFDQITEVCANVTCPFVKKRCDWIADNHKEFAGYLVSRLRPASLGFSYCMGTGECTHPNSTTMNTLIRTSEDPNYASLQLERIIDAILPHTNPIDMLDRLESEADRQLREYATDGGHHHGHCLARSTRFFFHFKLRLIRDFCEHTTCPHAQKACEWMKNHEEFTRGYVYGRMAPWKFAIGHCTRLEKCNKIQTE